jgi:hypothetical protein
MNDLTYEMCGLVTGCGWYSYLPGEGPSLETSMFWLCFSCSCIHFTNAALWFVCVGFLRLFPSEVTLDR